MSQLLGCPDEYPCGIINLIAQIFQAPPCDHDQSDRVLGMRQSIASTTWTFSSEVYVDSAIPKGLISISELS